MKYDTGLEISSIQSHSRLCKCVSQIFKIVTYNFSVLFLELLKEFLLGRNEDITKIPSFSLEMKIIALLLGNEKKINIEAI